MIQWFASHNSPQKGIQASVFLLNLQRGAGVGNCSFQFRPVADDPRVSEQFLNFFGSESCDFGGIKLTEGNLKCFALSQDSHPTESTLHGFENEHLEQAIVFVNGNAPFLIMIGNIKRILPRPTAAFKRS